LHDLPLAIRISTNRDVERIVTTGADSISKAPGDGHRVNWRGFAPSA